MSVYNGPVITNHWSVTPVSRQRDYHVEFGLTGSLDRAFVLSLGKITDPKNVDWEKLTSQFTIYKNNAFTDITSYGTFRFNSMLGQYPNIEVAMLGMDGSNVSTTGSWGSNPYTFAHAWMHAGIDARICQIKNIDSNASFDVSEEPDVLINGPIYVISTHGERALQTNDLGEDTVASRGYGLFSGDPEERWDIAVLDPSQNSALASAETGIPAVHASAGWIRNMAHLIKAENIADLWNLDKDPT